jgi:ATP-dependent DNA ligase
MRLSDLPPAPPVDALRPMLLDKRKHPPFDSPEWSFEVKYDGWRMLAEFGHGEPKLRTRSGLDASRYFPEICRALTPYSGGRHIIDAEVCVLDDLGRSDFERLQERARRKCWYEGCDPVALCIFDLLAQSGRSVMGLPYTERKTRLAHLFTPKPRHTLLVVQSIRRPARSFSCTLWRWSWKASSESARTASTPRRREPTHGGRCADLAPSRPSVLSLNDDSFSNPFRAICSVTNRRTELNRLVDG